MALLFIKGSKSKIKKNNLGGGGGGGCRENGGGGHNFGALDIHVLWFQILKKI